MILLVTLRVVFGMDNFVCRNLTCDAERLPFYDVCVSNRTEDSFIVHECRPGFVCDADIFNNYTNITMDVECLPIDQTYTCDGNNSLTNGRRCCTSNDCNSTVCMYGVCTGNSTCAVDEDCSGKFYCESSVCVSSYPAGKECTRDGQCLPGYGCNLGNCTQLVSLVDGSAAQDPKFCLTNYTYNDTCESILVFVNRTLQPSPFECFTEKDYCNYTRSYSNTSLSYEPCICSGLNQSLGYCSRYVIYDLNYSTIMLSYLSYEKSNCAGVWSSTIDPDILLECGSISLFNYYNYIKAFARGRFWNLEQSGILEQCGFMMNIFDPSATFGRALIVTLAILVLG